MEYCRCRSPQMFRSDVIMAYKCARCGHIVYTDECLKFLDPGPTVSRNVGFVKQEEAFLGDDGRVVAEAAWRPLTGPGLQVFFRGAFVAAMVSAVLWLIFEGVW